MRPIDGDKLIEFFFDLCGGNDSTSVKAGIAVIETVIQADQLAVTIDDLRPKGRWNIVEIDKANNRITVECSECGMVEEMYLTTYGMGHNYCHSCGADMQGGAND